MEQIPHPQPETGYLSGTTGDRFSPRARGWIESGRPFGESIRSATDTTKSVENAGVWRRTVQSWSDFEEPMTNSRHLARTITALTLLCGGIHVVACGDDSEVTPATAAGGSAGTTGDASASSSGTANGGTANAGAANAGSTSMDAGNMGNAEGGPGPMNDAAGPPPVNPTVCDDAGMCACDTPVDGGTTNCDCVGQTQCQFDCGSNCEVTCASGDGCVATVGPDSSGSCQGNGSCDFTCEGDCSFRCSGGSDCLVHCAAGANCAITACPTQVDCGDGVLACRTDCPSTSDAGSGVSDAGDGG